MAVKYVRDIMTREVISVGPSSPVPKIAEAMVKHDLTGVPVIRKGLLLGIVTDSDLVAQKSNIHPPKYLSALHAFISLRSNESVEKEIQKLIGSKAEDIMTSPVVTAKPSDSIDRLATKLYETRANPIPVVEDGKVVGIVSRHDLLQLIAREATTPSTSTTLTSGGSPQPKKA